MQVRQVAFECVLCAAGAGCAFAAQREKLTRRLAIIGFVCRYQHISSSLVGQQATQGPQQRAQRLLAQQTAAPAASASILGPAADGSPPALKRQRVSAEAVTRLAVEQPLPQYAVGVQWGTLLGSSSVGGGPGSLGTRTRARRPFASQLLAPAAVLDPPGSAALAASWGLHAELRYQLLPGCAVHRGSSGSVAAAVGRPADEPGLRYFSTQGSAQSSGSAAASGAAVWQQQYEQLLQAHPEDEQAWLSYAVRHAVEATRGGTSGALPAGGVGRMVVMVLGGTFYCRHLSSH